MRIGTLAAIIFTAVMANDKTRKLWKQTCEKIVMMVEKEMKKRKESEDEHIL